MSGIIPFDFESHAVRSVLIDGAPWFVAADVCRVLEHSNPAQAVTALDAHQVSKVDLNTLTSSDGIPAQNRGNPSALIVSEGGLYKLTMRSKAAVTPGTVQHRFSNWVVDFLLPTLRAQGYYAIPGAAVPDLEELAEKRAYLESLPEDQRAIARAKYEALCKIADAIEAGEKVSHAVRAAAAESGYSEKTLWNCRAATYMVPRCDWEAALAPKWRRQKGGMRIECHPEALRFFEGLAATGQRISDCYRRTVDVAAENGWEPVPGIHVLRRHAARVLPTPAEKECCGMSIRRRPPREPLRQLPRVMIPFEAVRRCIDAVRFPRLLTRIIHEKAAGVA
jgi:prophage antirepressor-like protein